MTNLPVESLTPSKLFVGCLPYSKNVYDLTNLFHPFGPILEVALLVGPDGKSKGAAFVTFAYTENAIQAIDQLNGYIFPNSTRPINVSLAAKQTFGRNIPNLSAIAPVVDFGALNYASFDLQDGGILTGNVLNNNTSSNEDVDKFLM